MSTKLDSLPIAKGSPDLSVTSSLPDASLVLADRQVLNGVSLGFNPPQITANETKFRGVIPHVISLPTSRSVPCHIQAPDWRHLLKAMSQLSESRIESSMEGLASTKAELKLRAVVQFVRVNANPRDWRTIIYLTVDVPPPPDAPSKFTNGDVNTLPFSYTTFPIFPILQSGPDTPTSKYYAIPATPNNPYPTLPVSFPNMATYLAFAVEDSRMTRGKSSGMKRLAKMLDRFYPAEPELGVEGDRLNKLTCGIMTVFKNSFRRGKRNRKRDDDADLNIP